MRLPRLPEWTQVPIAAAKSWNEDGAFKHSAAVSFYTLFSLAPITIISLGIASFVFGPEAASAQFSNQMADLVGKESAEFIQKTVQASQPQQQGWTSTVVGLVVLVVGATTVFAQLQESLNAIWGVRTRPERSGWLVLLVRRLISFAMVLTLGFLLLVSLILTTVLTAVVSYADDLVPVPPILLSAADMVVALGVVTLLFAMVFKIMPDVHLRWRDVWRGALVTALLFSIGRLLIALYLSHSTVASAYGAAGSLVALLIWIYYSCAILFYGAKFTRAHREKNGLPVKPKSKAMLVREVLEEESGGERVRRADAAGEQGGGKEVRLKDGPPGGRRA